MQTAPLEHARVEPLDKQEAALDMYNVRTRTCAEILPSRRKKRVLNGFVSHRFPELSFPQMLIKESKFRIGLLHKSAGKEQ